MCITALWHLLVAIRYNILAYSPSLLSQNRLFFFVFVVVVVNIKEQSFLIYPPFYSCSPFMNPSVFYLICSKFRLPNSSTIAHTRKLSTDKD